MDRMSCKWLRSFRLRLQCSIRLGGTTRRWCVCEVGMILRLHPHHSPFPSPALLCNVALSPLSLSLSGPALTHMLGKAALFMEAGVYLDSLAIASQVVGGELCWRASNLPGLGLQIYSIKAQNRKVRTRVSATLRSAHCLTSVKKNIACSMRLSRCAIHN
jgi:hypothetical protein